MPLHPEVEHFLATIAAQGPPPQQPGTLSPAEMREMTKAQWVRTAPMAEVGANYRRTIDIGTTTLPVRVFAPTGDGPFPLLVWFHGGGWVIGSPDENEAACRAICRMANCVVMSVDYRLAPEHRFPTAAEDAFASVRWVAEHGAELSADTSRLAVAGESAGGNLAAVCALMSRDRGGPTLALQVLVSPVLGSPTDGRQSYVDYADGYFMPSTSMDFFFAQYPRDSADLDDPYLLPLAASDLSGLAPALVLTAEYEVLRDEGEEYAHRLQAAGVACELIRFDGQIHGFFGLLDEHLSVSATAHAQVAAALRTAFAHSQGENPS